MYEFNIDSVVKTIKQFNFPRETGTENEKQAFSIVTKKLNNLNINWEYHTFLSKNHFIDSSCIFINDNKLNVKPATSLNFLYSFKKWMNIPNLDTEIVGKISEEPGEDNILIMERFDIKKIKNVTAKGLLLAFQERKDFITYSFMRKNYLPAVYIPDKEYKFIKQSKGNRCKIKWDIKKEKKEFKNLVAYIKGENTLLDPIIIGAHLDTFPGVVGSSDNASGVAILLEMLKIISKISPKRTVLGVFFTGEELDRRGSKQFVNDYLPKLERIYFYINIDSGVEKESAVEPYIRITPENKLKMLSKNNIDKNIRVVVKETNSADVTAFQQKDIPTIWCCGESAHPAHMPTDLPDSIDHKKLSIIGLKTLEIVKYLIK